MQKSQSNRKKSNILSKLAADEAEIIDMLPHEWLSRIAQGHPVKQMMPYRVIDSETDVETIEWRETYIYPDIDTRIDCAKACSQFFAPKFTAIKATVSTPQSKLSYLQDSEIDAMLLELAGEAEGEEVNNVTE